MIKYSPYSTVQVISVPLTFTLAKTGDGTGVTTMILNSTEEITITVDGNAKFYTDSFGTLNESAIWVVSSGADRTRYLKCSSGSSTLSISKNRITKIQWVALSNAPSISGSINGFNQTTDLLISDANAIWTGSTDNLPVTATRIQLIGNVTVSGDLGRFVSATDLIIKGTNTCSGDISANTAIINFEVTGNSTVVGNVENKTHLQILNGGNLTGSISNLTDLVWVYVGTGITCDRVINIKGLSTLILYYVTPTAQVNQLLADFWANRDEAKPRGDNVIRLNFAGSGVPSGQGITDKANLQSYRSPNNDPTKNLWVVDTN